MGCASSADASAGRRGDTDGSTDYISARLGLAMLQANKAAALMAGSTCASELQQELAQTLIRKAKNDGCTVSIVNGALYIDYKYVGQLPPEAT